jgi:hypothetical protein
MPSIRLFEGDMKMVMIAMQKLEDRQSLIVGALASITCEMRSLQAQVTQVCGRSVPTGVQSAGLRHQPGMGLANVTSGHTSVQPIAMNEPSGNSTTTVTCPAKATINKPGQPSQRGLLPAASSAYSSVTGPALNTLATMSPLPSQLQPPQQAITLTLPQPNHNVWSDASDAPDELIKCMSPMHRLATPRLQNGSSPRRSQLFKMFCV